MNNSSIYEPNEDSYLIGNELKKFKNLKVLDMGSGSGYLAKISLENNCDVLAADINKKSVELCKKEGIKAIQSNLFSKINGKFDLIVFNPPYLPEDKLEPKDSQLITTGGKQGHELIEKFLKQSKDYLNNNGKILLLYSSLSGDIPKIIKKYKFKSTILSQKSLFFEKLYVILLEFTSLA